MGNIRSRCAFLAACCVVFSGATFAQSLDSVTERAMQRAPALVDSARAACATAASHPSLSAYEIEAAIRDAEEEINRDTRSAADVPTAERRLQALAARIGPLDTTPSLDLQLLQATVAAAGDQTERRVDRRAFNLALMMAIAKSGDGKSTATAFRPCLVGNEYYFARTVLGATDVADQRLVQEDGRYYDRLIIVGRDGVRQDVFFDVTEPYLSQRKSLRKPPTEPPAR